VTASQAAARGRRASAQTLPSVAVVTMTRDEGAMLHRWVRHYGDAIGHQNLLVLDDNSSDGSTTDLGCPVLPLPTLPGGQEFERTRMRLINGFAEGLLACRDFVIFVDVDEYLIPDPAKFAGLREYLAARRDWPVIAPLALNVVHNVRCEGPIDPNRLVLDQRSFAKFMPGMCKPSIKQVPARWAAASHGIGRQYAVDPELFMLHLKFYDQDHLRSTGRKLSALVALDGRAGMSNWWHAGHYVRLLGQFVDGAEPDSVPEFDPRDVDVDELVIEGRHAERFRSRRQGQVRSMLQRPLVRIPRRLVGTL
jgi:hypothetical protein